MKKQIIGASLLVISYLGFGQTTWTTNGTNIYNANTGNVKIGGAALPKQKLDVSGNIAISGGAGELVFDGTNGFIDWGHAAAGDLNFRVMNFQGNLAQGTVNRMTLRGATGNLGIGTTTPNEKLHVIGSVQVDGSTGNGGVRIFKEGSTSITSHLYLSNTANLLSNIRAFNFQLNADGSAMTLWSFGGSAWNQRFTFTESGNLLINAPFGINGLDGNAKLAVNGKIQVGNSLLIGNPHFNDYMLSVNGKAVFKEVIVTSSNWADFVFDSNYQLPKLSEVEAFYKANKHLPEIPSANEVEQSGISVGEMNKLLLQKIEELTIYLVEQQKEIEKIKEKSSK